MMRFDRLTGVDALYLLTVLVAIGMGSLGAASSGWAGQTEATVPPVAAIPREYFGMHIHRADRGTRWPGQEIGAWRLWDANAIWIDIEPERGRWDFSRLDRYVRMAELTKTQILYPFGMSPQWASARPDEKGMYRPGASAEPASIEDWENMIRTVVRRYKSRITQYDVWNEVNAGTGFFTGTPEAMLRLQEVVYRTVKQEDPAAIVVSPSVVGDVPHQLAWFEKYLALGAARYADVIGYHFYKPREPPEELIGFVRKVRAIMARHGAADKALWNTESGYRMDYGQKKVVAALPSWPALSARRAAGYVARSLILGRWAGIERFYWYAWDNVDLGFVTPDGSLAPAGAAYLKTARWLTGSRLNACNREATVWVCAIQRGTGSAWLVWNEKEDELEWSSPLLRSVRTAESLEGETVPARSLGSIRIDGRPILLSDSDGAWAASTPMTSTTGL